MIVQISVEDDFIEKLKKTTGQKTASKAFMYAANSYSNLVLIIAKGNEPILLDDYEGFKRPNNDGKDVRPPAI